MWAEGILEVVNRIQFSYPVWVDSILTKIRITNTGIDSFSMFVKSVILKTFSLQTMDSSIFQLVYSLLPLYGIIPRRRLVELLRLCDSKGSRDLLASIQREVTPATPRFHAIRGLDLWSCRWWELPLATVHVPEVRQMRSVLSLLLHVWRSPELKNFNSINSEYYNST